MISNRSQQLQVTVMYRKEKEEVGKRAVYIGTEDDDFTQCRNGILLIHNEYRNCIRPITTDRCHHLISAPPHLLLIGCK